MKPLSLLSFAKAYLFWRVLSVLAMIVALLLTVKMGGVKLRLSLALILGVGLFSYYPFQWDLIYGQVGCFICLFTVLSLWLLSRHLTVLSAFSFALATMIKLTPFLAVPVMIFHRRWRWLAAYGCWLGAIMAFSVYQGGWGIERQFFLQVLPGLSCGSPICLNASLPALVQQLFLHRVPSWWDVAVALPPHACTVSRLVGAIVCAGMLWRFWLRRRGANLLLHLMLIALVALSVSPISWWHHYTIALLPFLYLWCTLGRKGSGALAAMVVLVGTNVIGIAQLLNTNAVAGLVLSSLLPLLTLAFVYSFLSETLARPDAHVLHDAAPAA